MQTWNFIDWQSLEDTHLVSWLGLSVGERYWVSLKIYGDGVLGFERVITDV